MAFNTWEPLYSTLSGTTGFSGGIVWRGPVISPTEDIVLTGIRLKVNNTNAGTWHIWQLTGSGLSKVLSTQLQGNIASTYTGGYAQTTGLNIVLSAGNQYALIYQNQSGAPGEHWIGSGARSTTELQTFSASEDNLYTDTTPSAGKTLTNDANIWGIEIMYASTGNTNYILTGARDSSTQQWSSIAYSVANRVTFNQTVTLTGLSYKRAGSGASIAATPFIYTTAGSLLMSGAAVTHSVSVGAYSAQMPFTTPIILNPNTPYLIGFYLNTQALIACEQLSLPLTYTLNSLTAGTDAAFSNSSSMAFPTTSTGGYSFAIRAFVQSGGNTRSRGITQLGRKLRGVNTL